MKTNNPVATPVYGNSRPTTNTKSKQSFIQWSRANLIWSDWCIMISPAEAKIMFLLEKYSIRSSILTAYGVRRCSERLIKVKLAQLLMRSLLVVFNWWLKVAFKIDPSCCSNFTILTVRAVFHTTNCLRWYAFLII